MQTEQERIYKRAYLVLKMYALRNNAYLVREEFPTLNLPIPEGILDDVLLKLQADGDVKISHDAQGRTVYDFLVFLERSLAESALDLPPRLELARIYLSRQMWTPAIAGRTTDHATVRAAANSPAQATAASTVLHQAANAAPRTRPNNPCTARVTPW